jgi:hypothetical protein
MLCLQSILRGQNWEKDVLDSVLSTKVISEWMMTVVAICDGLQTLDAAHK